MLQPIFNEFVTDLIQDCLSDAPNPQFYVPSERQILRLKNNLISNTFIIYGPTGSGKTSCVYWAASFDPTLQLIVIDCEIDTTQIQFVRSVYFGIVNNSKNKQQLKIHKNDSYLYQNMKFDQLNHFIKESGKKYLFVIKKCEKIAQMKKPTLFYNLLQWINSPMKDYLGLVFLSRAFHFTDKLEKRVKSRLTAKTVTLVRPQGQKIIQIYVKRFLLLKRKYEQTLINHKQSHSRRTDSYLKIKLEWLHKILRTIEFSEEFQNLVNKSINAINNQFVSCMKIALIKSLHLDQLQKNNQNLFSKYFVQILEQATEHIAPNFYKNLIIQCPIYTILVLSLICYMGINEILPYKMSTVFEIYKSKVLNSSKFNQIINQGSSKIFFEKALTQLIDMRIVSITKEEEVTGKDVRMREFINKQLELAIPPYDLQEVISQMNELPQMIKEIVKG